MNVNPQIGNLLHHRGHTHTVLIAFFQSLLIFGLVRLFQRRFGKSYFKSEWKLISLLAFLGPLTHILLDFVNHYGVHPFWPISSRWHFGDFLFVLEPWLWVTFSVALLFQTHRWKTRAWLFLIPILALSLSWGLGSVPVLMCGVISLWALLLLIVFYFSSQKTRVLGCWGALGVLLFAFYSGSKQTQIRVAADWPEEPGFHTSDWILSPLPVNPFCWSVIRVSKSKEEYQLQRALVAPYPEIVALGTCSSLKFFSPGTEPPPGEAILKDHPIRQSLSTLRQHGERFCEVRDALQFFRAPYYFEEKGTLYLSDLRFERAAKAREARRSFARIKIDPSRVPPCPPSWAPWEPPFQLD